MRRDKRIQELEQDPYKERGHLHDPTVCPECHATYRDGRWTWAAGPADAPRVLCPACRRTRDRHPAGTVVLRGPFLAAHRDDILHLVRNVEEREKAEHALQRILAIEEREGEVEVTTTDLHLARAIGSALHAAHKGDVDYQYADEETHLRVVWER